MSSESDDFMASLRETIEKRVNEQIDRHARIDPNFDRRKAVDIQIEQEIEQLELLLEKYEESPAIYDAIDLLREWLPEYGRQIRSR